MIYTVGEMAQKLGVPASTLRYYDKEGLLPFVERSSGGIRMFRENDFEWLQVIRCMKKAGMSIKDIRQYIELSILNTINFKKSMHYNPFAYVHSEKDILKLVTTLMTNTKGEGSGGDPFWEKSERLLLTALIAYLHYEAPVEEQNFATLLEMLNTMQVLEDDEEYQNPVDLLFEELAKKKPNSFAGRQYKLYKLAAGDICSK